MTRFIAVRLAQIVLTLYLFLTLVFFLIAAQPGDVSTFFARSAVLPDFEQRDLEADFGVDQPIARQ